MHPCPINLMSIVLNVHLGIQLYTRGPGGQRFAVRSWKGPNGIERYWLIVQVFSGLGRDNQGLNPSGVCRTSRASGPIHG